MRNPVELEQAYGASNYLPLPVTLVRGEGCHVWDDTGKQYIDMMSAYSAVSFGHAHPRLLQVLTDQANTLAVVSRAYYTDKLGRFLERICKDTKLDRCLPMNSGAEAVETAMKVARKWAYTVKGVPENKAELISATGNFHGRTIAVVGMSSEPGYKASFGPFPDGLLKVAYGDAAALEAAITPNTAAFIVESIQGEGGIIVPPEGYLKQVSDICKKHNVLLICDEIQCGMARTGKLLACWHEDVQPDGLILGKALGGGLLPVSAFLARNDVMGVLKPGEHGSTFGGNPLAAAVGYESLLLVEEENLAQRSAELGQYFKEAVSAMRSPLIKEVRGKGLFVGVEIAEGPVSARDICLAMMEKGVLSKETHKTVIRFAPPLVISKEQLDTVLGIFEETLARLNT